MSQKWWPGPMMVSGSGWRIVAFIAAVMLLVGVLMLGVALIHGAKVLAAGLSADPVHICDAPEYQGWTGWECISYLEYYDYVDDKLALVGNVSVDGQPRHTMGGFSLPYQYSTDPMYTVADELLPVMGCPEYQDAVELAQIGQGAEIEPGKA
jgi:hypothetical protein